MWGMWFIGSNVVRDLAALNKMELLPWGVWGPMSFREGPDAERAMLIDSTASTIASDDLAAIQRLYQRRDGLAVPATIFDARFCEPYLL
jgi:hypothetical protein